MFGKKGGKSVRLFFTSDLHGSDVTFRKFLNASKMYEADVLIIGGDLAGKALATIIDKGNGVYEFDGKEYTSDRLQVLTKELSEKGVYYKVVTHTELEELSENKRAQEEAFKQAITDKLRSWSDVVRSKGINVPIYYNLGNDDPEYAAEAIPPEVMKRSEGEVIPLPGNYEMISYGVVNPTPWNTYREAPEEKIHSEIKRMMDKVSDPSRTVVNVHAPPYGTNLDNAFKLTSDLRPVVRGGEIETDHVGSKSVRKVIEEFKPLLGIHGHIHESRGFDRIGETLIFNPGSEYNAGILHALLVILENGKVKTHQFITG
ncbi:metallophosphoesterase [Sulfolobales archaeon HS-7]|nr:metallophosphoesterase [Sulfolobales archaeon HS-7]